MAYRLRDIGLAVLVLLLASWLFLLIMLALALTQKRVFFTQVRTGMGDRPFTLIKFSTLRDILPGEKEEDTQRYRLTPVGAILRKTSLDELPNLFNVLAGQMSLVGPRPLLHDYLPLYSQEQRLRHTVRPGITGWAQVNGRNALSFTERFKLDVWYVRNRTFSLDLKILWMTLGKVFRAGGVYVDGENTSPRFDGNN